tara:strand:+ start:320 stop:514 length:195 start_codon:yes stop_codon:yes gene_type:complete
MPDLIERINDFGSTDFFVDHKDCGWFHTCYSCGDMILYSEDHFLQVKGMFAGHNQCKVCWKGEN